MSTEKSSKVMRETIFGWFPADQEKPRRSPVDVYMNLGSRHPKEESSIEEKMLKEYIKEINSEVSEDKSNNSDQEVDPPWALCHKPSPNKPVENFNRSKSAPITCEWRAKKAPLNIPKPILKNIFEKEPKHIYFSINKKILSEKEKRMNDCIESDKVDDCSKTIDQPYFIESFNMGKQPIISQKENEKNQLRRKKIRPKTALVYNKPNQGGFLTYNKRPKSTVSIRPKSSVTLTNNENKFKSSEFLKSKTELEIKPSGSAKTEPVNEKPKNLLENWKSNLLERKKFLHPRPNYFVRIDMNKLQADNPAPEIHYNSPDTYFLNTMPFRKATFTIDPSFISENLNVQKIDLKRKDSSSSKNAVRYRRDFAFVY